MGRGKSDSFFKIVRRKMKNYFASERQKMGGGGGRRRKANERNRKKVGRRAIKGKSTVTCNVVNELLKKLFLKELISIWRGLLRRTTFCES